MVASLIFCPNIMIHNTRSYSYRTPQLVLWREHEPDCVPELPQFTLVCHSHGILNTLAKTCPIKYTGTKPYTHTRIQITTKGNAHWTS